MAAALRVGYNEAAAAAGVVLETMKRSSRLSYLSVSPPSTSSLMLPSRVPEKIDINHRVVGVGHASLSSVLGS